MPTLRIDVEKVEDLARQVKAERDSTVEQLLAKLRNINSELDSAWDGPAQDQFTATYGDWINKLQSYSDTLTGVNTYLMSVADNFRKLDEAARSAASQAAAGQA